jgi:hypothetical protein
MSRWERAEIARLRALVAKHVRTISSHSATITWLLADVERMIKRLAEIVGHGRKRP